MKKKPLTKKDIIFILQQERNELETKGKKAACLLLEHILNYIDYADGKLPDNEIVIL